MPPLEKGKKYLVRPKPGFPDRPNLDRIMNNPDIRQPPTAKFLGGTAFNFDSGTAPLGVYTNLNKFYWVFTPVDGGDPVAVDDQNDPQPVVDGGRRRRKTRGGRHRRRHGRKTRRSHK